MIKKLCVVRGMCVAGVAVMLTGLTGCTSYRIHATAKPVSAGSIPQGSPQFQIVSVAFVSPTNLVSSCLPAFGGNTNSSTLASLLTTDARDRYPALFSAAPQAIPLQVTVSRVANESYMGEAAACVSCLTLTILPLRTADRTDYRLDLATVPPRAVAGLKNADYSLEETGWMSILPGGWIPVPGGRGERAWGTDSALNKTRDIMVKACVDSIVTILRQVEPSAWTAPAATP